jgi:hypothetical protein
MLVVLITCDPRDMAESLLREIVPGHSATRPRPGGQHSGKSASYPERPLTYTIWHGSGTPQSTPPPLAVNPGGAVVRGR